MRFYLSVINLLGLARVFFYRRDLDGGGSLVGVEGLNAIGGAVANDFAVPCYERVVSEPHHDSVVCVECAFTHRLGSSAPIARRPPLEGLARYAPPAVFAVLIGWRPLDGYPIIVVYVFEIL